MIPSTWKIAFSLLTVLCSPTLALAEEDLRRYLDGPLTIGDFRAKIPEGATKDAQTATRLKFEYRYEYQTRDGRTIVSLTNISVDAFVRRDESWNRRPDNKHLLEHEQGHADIAWIHCLQARLAFHDRTRRGRKWAVTAATVKEGVTKLEGELSALLATFEQAGRDADAEYDRETRHGLGPNQFEWRRLHVETIKRLEAEWKERN